MLSRKQIADGLKKACTSYLLKKGFSCHLELGLCKWGKLKADVIAVNLKGYIVIGEVKSSVQDYKTDKKWINYLEFANKFYFVFTRSTWDKLSTELLKLKDAGAGVLILSDNGYLKCVVPAKYKPMNGKTRRSIITRMAWRNGDVSKRTNRRVRVYLEE